MLNIYKSLIRKCVNLEIACGTLANVISSSIHMYSKENHMYTGKLEILLDSTHIHVSLDFAMKNNLPYCSIEV